MEVADKHGRVRGPGGHRRAAPEVPHERQGLVPDEPGHVPVPRARRRQDALPGLPRAARSGHGPALVGLSGAHPSLVVHISRSLG